MADEPPLPVAVTRLLQAYKLPIILGGISIFAIAISIILLIKSVATSAPIEFSSDEVATRSSEIKIDVEGAVFHPGLYSLTEGSRVEDAITAAGGVKSDVDEAQFAKTVNRAMKLVDGAKLYIPSLSDVSLPGSTSQSEQRNGLIPVNTASEGELDTLPGVGPVTAKKIIDNRPYQTLEELVSKKAVGAALFEKVKNQLSL